MHIEIMDSSMLSEILRLLTELRDDIRTSVSIFESLQHQSPPSPPPAWVHAPPQHSSPSPLDLGRDEQLSVRGADDAPLDKLDSLISISDDDDERFSLTSSDFEATDTDVEHALLTEAPPGDCEVRHECLHVEAATTITSEIHSKSNLYLSQHECLPVNAATTTVDSIKFMAEIHDEIDVLPPSPKAEAQLYVNLTHVDSYIRLSCAAAATPVSGSSTNDYADTDDNVEGLYNPADAEEEVPLQPPQAPPGDPKPLSGLLHHKFKEGVANVVLDVLVLKADHCPNVLTSALPVLLSTSNAITNLAMNCGINVLAVPPAPPQRPQDARRNVTLKPSATIQPARHAISNMSSSMFGVLWRLEPLTLVPKALWTREMEWLISMLEYSIFELTPSIQELPDSGGQFEVMVLHPCSDLYTNLQALKKLHAMLLAIIDMHIERKLSKLYADVCLSDVREMFDEMADQDCIPWNMLMDNCNKVGDISGAVGMFPHMTASGCRPNILTLACFLSVCTTQAELLSGVQHHSLAVNCEKEPEVARDSSIFRGFFLSTRVAKQETLL